MKLSQALVKSIFISATQAQVQSAVETNPYEVTACNNENSSVSVHVNLHSCREKPEMNSYYQTSVCKV